MNVNLKKITTLLLTLTVFVSCKEDKDDGLAAGTLELSFSTTVGGETLSSNQNYQNNAGETYTIQELKYIVSNFQLVKDDGTIFTYPVDESYFVIDTEIDSSQRITLTDIPAGNYEKVRFGFGVDPTKYPIESGTLNFIPTAEEAGMLWSWSAGYKFIKLEGTFIAQGESTSAPYLIHVGSHGATLDNYKEIEVSLLGDVAGIPFPINATTEAFNEVVFDVSQVFDGTNTIRIADKPDIQVDPVNAPKIAENISTAFFVPQG